MARASIPASIMALDDPGDENAPPDTPAWARAMRYRLYRLVRDSTTTLRAFQSYLSLMERHRGYQQLDDEHGHPFPSLKAFCIARVPFGLGYDLAIVEALQAETKEMLLGEKVAEVQALHLKAGAPEGNQNATKNNDSNRIIESQHPRGGTNRAYLLARIKRDTPEIFAKYELGEYPSVRAAAKAAGCIHDPTPLDYLHRYWRKVSPEDRLRFLTEMLTPSERRALLLGFEEDLG